MDKITYISSNYYQYKVNPDGHCFLNSILEVFSPEYRNLEKEYTDIDILKNKQKSMLRKLRCDIANILISESNFSFEQIHRRLAFLNPETMCRFFYLENNYDEDGDYKSIFPELELMSKLYDGNNQEEIYKFIASTFKFRDNTEISAESVRSLYESDFRMHLYNFDRYNYDKYESESKKERDISSLGIGIYSPTINYYAFCKTIQVDNDEIEATILNLIDFDIENDTDSFIEYNTSIIITNLFDLNIISFPIGLKYSEPLELSEYKKGKPYILMINHSNIHWNLIGYYHNNSMKFAFENISEQIKNLLFQAINEKFNRRKLFM